MKLYCKAGACSLSAHIVLHECGLDFTQVTVDLAQQLTERQEDYRQINPKGQVPALQFDDGTVLTEVTAILQYLADLKPDRHLLAPVGSLTRYQTLEWLSFFSSEMHKTFRPLFMPDKPESEKPLLRSRLESKFRYVDAALRDKQWLTGVNFTVADTLLFVMLRWAKTLTLELTDCTALEEWYQRMLKRPAVLAALKAEGLSGE